jgi:hypothetical protein
MIRLYRWLLFLHPADYRAIFAAEMSKVFDEARAEAWNRGAWARLAFCLRELTGLVWTASYAHVRIHSGWADRVKGFSQSRAAVPRLTLVFAAVVATIEILKSFVLRGHHMQSILWHEVLLAILGALTVILSGAAGWAITFLFGRSGVHRIAKIGTRSGQK